MTTYYIAYGSNLNKEQMRRRCPKAKDVGRILLPDYRLVFKGVADIVEAKGYFVPVGLWLITEECEQALDTYEGYPRLYRKQYWNWSPDGSKRNNHLLMAYVMNIDEIRPPSQQYYDSISDGYYDFAIPTCYLEEALEHSYEYQWC